MHNNAGDGDCYYRSVCLSSVIPITDHRDLRLRLCTGLRNILKFPLSEEYKLISRYYSHSDDSKKYSIKSYLKHRMCHDSTWASAFEMMLTALIFDFQVISLANKPGHLWPFGTKHAAESYRYPHFDLMEKRHPIFIYCHSIFAPFIATAKK